MARQRASQQAQAAFSRVGTAPVSPAGDSDDQQQEEQAPRTHGVQDPEAHDAPGSRPHEVATSREGDAATSRRRRGPVAAEAVAFTVRFDQEEALAVDELVLAMRRMAGRRVDKSEIVRALLRLTRDRQDLRQDLAGELREEEMP